MCLLWLLLLYTEDTYTCLFPSFSLLLLRWMHVRDGIKGHYSIQWIKYIVWLIFRNPRTKGPPSGPESSLFRTNPRQLPFENVWHDLHPAPEAAQQRELCHWEAASLSSLEFGTPAPDLAFPHSHHRPSQSAPGLPQSLPSCPGILLFCVAKCDSPSWFPARVSS